MEPSTEAQGWSFPMVVAGSIKPTYLEALQQLENTGYCQSDIQNRRQQDSQFLPARFETNRRGGKY